ncbi:sodium/sulfate transporter [Salmonella enterica subsp. enterica]|uniref:Sodium/sulfate transporter n=1 Tax=Salmonella enterica I TaxID=59201 RepID=A0A447TZ47_SALET|nr:sodium/sulfate transporter [Salmonella enterica subsp. enterica]
MLKARNKAIHWPSIILIVGMMPFALALQKNRRRLSGPCKD